jgi:cytochrome c553
MMIGYRRSIAGLVLATALVAVPAMAQRGGRPARPEVDLPDGPVRQVILRSCTACHGIDEYGFYAMDRDAWNDLIDRMKTARSGVVEGAVISDEDKEILLGWLVGEFGPDRTPFPREYVPRDLSEADYLSDDQAEALLASACESCHTLERVDQTRANEEQWRATLIAMIGRGAPLATSDIEPLVEWLGRTRGTNPTN